MDNDDPLYSNFMGLTLFFLTWGSRCLVGGPFETAEVLMLIIFHLR